MSGLTLDMIRRTADLMRTNQIRPNKVQNAKEARAFNRQSRAIAELAGTTPHTWRVGDEYYTVFGHPEWEKLLDG